MSIRQLKDGRGGFLPFFTAFFASIAFFTWTIYCTKLSRRILSHGSPSTILIRQYLADEYTSATGTFTDSTFSIPYFNFILSKPLTHIPFQPNQTSGQICPPCSIGADSPGADSSPRDLILTLFLTQSAFASDPNPRRSKKELTFFRAVRRTGCRATIVVLAETRAAPSVPIGCDVRVIDIGVLNTDTAFHSGLLRHYVLSRFLNLYRQDFDRVLICDLETTFVQGDPFTTHFKAKTLGVPLIVGREPSAALLNNLEGIDVFYDRRFYERLDVISDKLIWGAVPLVLRLYEIVMKHPRLQAGDMNYSFVAYLNYCYANHVFEKLDFFPRLGTPGDDFSFAVTPSTIAGPLENGGRTTFTIAGCARPPLVLSGHYKTDWMGNAVCHSRMTRTPSRTPRRTLTTPQLAPRYPVRPVFKKRRPVREW
jgi:hypothetical protein